MPAFEITCPCGETFTAKSSRAKWCSEKCRKRRQRAGDVIELPTKGKAAKKGDGQAAGKSDDDAPPTFTGGVYKSTRKALEEAERLDTPLGQTCLVLARRLDFPALDTGSAIATLADKLDKLLASALRGAAAASKPQQLRDELAERRRQHGA